MSPYLFRLTPPDAMVTIVVQVFGTTAAHARDRLAEGRGSIVVSRWGREAAAAPLLTVTEYFDLGLSEEPRE